ncbi:MAG: hypothetical protein R3A79_19450 [Nannocystaceae bacterium]
MNKPFNSYRRNAQGSGDYCAPDLVLFELDAEIEACPQISACVKVANQGCLGVGPGVKVSFYEEELGLLGTVETVGPITPGGSESVCFMTESEKLKGQIWASVDDDGEMMGALNECVENNNSTPKLPLCFLPD